MTIRDDAIALRKEYEEKTKAEWKYGKGTCCGYGVDGLTSYFEYNHQGTKNNRRTNGSTINAVVVTTWRGQKIAFDKQKVLLTSLPAEEDAADIQTCVIHQIRNTIKYIGSKHQKEFMKDLKTVYKAATEEVALQNLELLENKWGSKYSVVINSWYNNWENLSTFFKYAPNPQDHIYNKYLGGL
jgi:hypothetical protein